MMAKAFIFFCSYCLPTGQMKRVALLLFLVGCALAQRYGAPAPQPSYGAPAPAPAYGAPAPQQCYPRTEFVTRYQTKVQQVSNSFSSKTNFSFLSSGFLLFWGFVPLTKCLVFICKPI